MLAVPPSPLAADAVAGVTDPVLRAVIADHWEHMMRWSPTYATTLGDHRFDDRLARRDLDSIKEQHAERDRLIARLAALDATKLAETDRVSYALLRGRLEADRGTDICMTHEWLVDSGGSSVFGELSYLVEGHIVKTTSDAGNVVARLAQGETLIDDTIANLRRGLAHGRVSSAEKLRRAIEQLDAELAKPIDSWVMLSPLWAKAPRPDPWPAGERDRQLQALRVVVIQKIEPAVVRLRDFLRDRVLPVARKDNEGLVGLPDGAACYRAAILTHVGIAMDPKAIHALGLAEIAKTDRDLAELGAKTLGTKDLASTIAKLRTDRSLYFSTREEILAAAQAQLDRAKAAIPRFFNVLPKTDCVMRETPAYEAPYSTVAYYRQPNYDGSKPGEYFVNTYQPEPARQLARPYRPA